MSLRSLFCGLAAAVVSLSPLLGAEGSSARYFPVVSGTVGGQTYRTTVDLRNTGGAPVECRFEFRSAKRPDSPLVSVVPVPPGAPQLLDEFLREIPIASAIRVTCPGDVEVYSRIHESADNGATYSDGRLFRAVTANLITPGKPRTIESDVDLVIAEVAGRPATVTVTFTAKNDGSTATKTYDLLPFGQRLLDVSRAVSTLGPLRMSLGTEGAGEVIVTKETRDATLADRARRLPDDQRELFEQRTRLERVSVAAATTADRAPITPQLLIAPFKAAPFQDPATGLIFMRDRWYDPSTGTFLTPDPEGYRDSSNPYIYCAGDPVNCSDPTGRAAAVGKKGWIVGHRPDGSKYRFAPEYARQNPLHVQTALESDADLTRADVARLMAQAGLPMGRTTLPCLPGQTCLSRGRPATRYGQADYAIGPAVSASNALIGFSNQVNRVNGHPAVPYIPYASQRQEWAGDRFDEVQLALAVPAMAAGGVNALARPQAFTSRVFRVEGTPNTRILISDAGHVTVVGDDMLFLNFGSRARAEAFFAKRLEQGMPSVVVKEFDVPYSFLEDLRAAAVPERLARQFPDRPILVDPTKAPDQFGLRPDQIRALQDAVVQGSGTTRRP